jgi:UDP-2,3-diacylglucosamine pyrophosphatase LpxH
MGTKAIVMSDHHISNCAPYSWCSEEELSSLCDLLERESSNPDVEEIVLLGDLFDFWLYPVDVVPLTAAQIIDSNPRLVKALKQCVEKLPNVYYIPGNHDMEITQEDLTPFCAGEKTLRLVPFEQYNALHPGRHFEHGNAVDMFNAPDNADDTIGRLPLGFFITRLVASAKAPEDAKASLHDALTRHIAEHAVRMGAPNGEDKSLLGDILVNLIVDTLQISAELHDDTPIRFSCPVLDSRNITVKDIKKHYGSLLDTWWEKTGHSLEALLDAMLVGLRKDGLDWYAKKLEKSSSPPPLIVLGHTHHAESMEPYYNDGCWCRTHGQTYVVIEGNKATPVTLS